MSYLVGPSPGRVDLPTYVIFDTPYSDVANRYDGSLVGGAKYALLTTPALGRELLQNSDFSNRGSLDQGWSLLDPNTTFDRDSSSDWVEIAGTDLEPPAPDGRNVVQAVEARGRQRYLVSFEYRSTGEPGDARVFGQVLDSSGAAAATFPDGAGYLGSASGNWVVGSFYVDTGDASTIVVVLRNAGRHAVSFERVSLRPVISERVPGTPLR